MVVALEISVLRGAFLLSVVVRFTVVEASILSGNLLGFAARSEAHRQWVSGWEGAETNHSEGQTPF